MARRARRSSRRGVSAWSRRHLTRLIKRLWKQDWFRRGLAWLFLIVVSINLSVRLLGKNDTFPLDPFHLLDKSRALAALAWHGVVGVRQPSESEIKRHLHRLAVQHKIPPGLAIAVAETESGLMPVRISRSGAMGLMQLMPGTAFELGVRDPFDARQNASGGVRYLAQLYVRYRGDTRRTAAAYNAGPGNVPTSGAFRMRRETSNYVVKVQCLMALHSAADGKRDKSK